MGEMITIKERTAAAKLAHKALPKMSEAEA